MIKQIHAPTLTSNSLLLLLVWGMAQVRFCYKAQSLSEVAKCFGRKLNMQDYQNHILTSNRLLLLLVWSRLQVCLCDELQFD